MAVREFLLPDLGEGLEDAEVVAWHVAEGDTVELNQVLAEVNTAKATVEIPSPWGGVVATLHGSVGDVVKVGSPLVSINVEEAPAEAAEQATQVAMESGLAEAETAARAEEAETTKPKRRAVLVGYGVEEEETVAVSRPAKREARGPVRATPPVRKLAKEQGLELASISGTGPNGRITRDDVIAAAGSTVGGKEGSRAPGHPDDVELIPVRGTRRLIAEKMARSASEIPHVTTFLTVDCHWLQLFRSELAGTTGTKVSPLPIVVASLCQVIGDHPLLNASFRADAHEIAVSRGVHMGIATDTDQGLLVTVVRDAQGRGIGELSEEIRRLSKAARSGKAKPEDVTGSTITVSNVGSFGAEYGTPIINHPEAAVLALGVIEDRPMAVDGQVVIRPACTLSLSFDHRVMDGAQAGRALKALGDLLESPFRLGALPR